MPTPQQFKAAFDKHGSDKSQHGYHKFYAEQMIDNPTSILEIGIKQGASARAFKELFPSSHQYGLDLFMEFPMPAVEGVQFFKGNQLDHELLYHIRNDIKPQIIIEDGSHNSADQWVTLFSLIGCCEWYFLEDMHCAKDESYRQGLSFDETVLGSILKGTFPFFYILSADQKIAVIKSYSRLGKIKLP